MNHKVLVAYFSATGVTARAAQKVADATGGEVYAISGSAATLKRSYPALEWKEGCLLNRADEKTVLTWIDRLRYLGIVGKC